MLFPFSISRKTKKPRTSRTPSHRRPTFEILEDRVLLALSFMGQLPSGIQTGQIMAPFTVHTDQGMNVPITISLSEGSTAGTPLLAGTVTRNTDASGNVSFSDLYVYGGTAKNAVFTVTAPRTTGSTTLDTAVSNTFEIKAGGSQLYVSTTIPTTAAGADLGSIKVQILDANGSVNTNDNTTKLQLYIENHAGNQVTQASNTTTGTATISVKDASALAFGMSVTGPGMAPNSTITATHPQNNTVTLSLPATATATGVSLTFTPNFIDTQGKLIGSLSSPVTVSQGVATFTGLALSKAGIGYMLGVTAVNSTFLMPATSNAFVVTAGDPTALAFAVQPTYTDFNPINRFINNNLVGVTATINEYNSIVSYPNTWNGVVVQAVDKFGNPVTGEVTGAVTMSTNGALNLLTNGFPVATTQVNIDPASQVAAFTNLVWQQTTLSLPTATSTQGSNQITLTSVIQASFQNGMVFTGPGFPFGAGVTITNVIKDQTDKNKVTLTLSKQADNTAGTGLFAWNFAGKFTLTATASNVTYKGRSVSLQAATSQSFGVSPFPPNLQPQGTVTSFGSRSKLQFEPGFTLPATAAVGTALPKVKVQVVDPNGNVVVNDNSTVIVMNGGGNITGTLTQTVVNGIATFDDLNLSGSGLTVGGLPASP